MKRIYGIIYLFIFASTSAFCDTTFVNSVINSILSSPGNTTIPKTTKELVSEKKTNENVYFTVKEEELENCLKLGPVQTNYKIEYWEFEKSCDLLLKNLIQITAIKGGNTLYIHPKDFECKGAALKGLAYKCHK